jgi:hypothetical protein
MAPQFFLLAFDGQIGQQTQMMEKGKNLLPLQGIQPQLFGSPAHSLVAILTVLS